MVVWLSTLTLTESSTSLYSMQMRNWNLHILLLALCVMMSCAKDNAEIITVEYKASIYEYEVKSLGDGSQVNYIWYAVYNSDGSLFYQCGEPAVIEAGKAYCPVKMVLGKQYRVVFLAMHYDDQNIPAYDVDAADALVRYSARVYANNDKGDLFYTHEDVEAYRGMVAKGVELERIGAQINFLCNASDCNAAQQRPKTSALELSGVPTAFSLIEGKVTGTSGNVSYQRTDLPEGGRMTVNGDYVVFSAYAFAPPAPQTTEAAAVLKMWNEGSAGNEDYAISIPRMQLQSNVKTNVKGDLISEGNKLLINY